MSFVTTQDGVEIFFKDWGAKNAVPIVFHHGWPLSADDWDTQMLFFLAKGYRVVAHDRRGHGRSSQVADGHTIEQYAADANAVYEHLNLKNAVHIGHSTGGGVVARYVAKNGEPQTLPICQSTTFKYESTEQVSKLFDQHFAALEARHDLLAYPGSFDLRHQIRTALGDLYRALGSYVPDSGSRMWA